MKTKAGIVIAGLAMVIVAAMLVPVASAGCGKIDRLGTGAALWQERSGGGDSRDDDPIVGFWKVKLVSKGNAGIPDDVVLDAGYSQGHSDGTEIDRKSTRLNSSHTVISYAVFCLKKKTK